jgi:hypothetical protein
MYFKLLEIYGTRAEGIDNIDATSPVKRSGQWDDGFYRHRGWAEFCPHLVRQLLMLVGGERSTW